MKNGTETINDFLNGLQEGNEHLVDVAREMLTDKDGKVSEKITFALQKRRLEPEQPQQRIRAESRKRSHELHSAASFVDYLKGNKTEKTVVLANVEQCQIVAILDESVKNGFECIRFTPQVHPLFKPWQSIIGSDTPVKEFAVFLQQNKRTVVTPEVQELTLMFRQIRASQKITVQSGIGPHSINGLTCELNIVGKRESKEVELPDLIVLDVPLFIDTPKQKVEIDVLVDAVDTEVFVTCSSSDYEVKKVEAFEEMLQQVKQIEGIIVGFGTVETQDWSYLR